MPDVIYPIKVYEKFHNYQMNTCFIELQIINISIYPLTLTDLYLNPKSKPEEKLLLVDSLQELSKNKPVLIILNKADLSDPKKNEIWKDSFDNCLLIDSLNENITNIVVNEVKTILADKLERAKRRGIRKKVLRAVLSTYKII